MLLQAVDHPRDEDACRKERESSVLKDTEPGGAGGGGENGRSRQGSITSHSSHFFHTEYQTLCQGCCVVLTCAPRRRQDD